MSQTFISPTGEVIHLPAPMVPLDLAAAVKVWDAALCAETDAELFFPAVGEPGRAAQARAVCEACEVRQLCLDTFGPLIEHGVVGGRSPRERRGTRRSSRARRGTAA